MKKQETRGKVYLVGAGPGDAGLLTLRGAKCLDLAEVVIYDGLVNKALLELAPRAEKIEAGKTGKKSSETLQRQINSLMVKYARAGKQVARLKGGDPFIFGRGGEESCYLKKSGVEFEVVPGVSAGYAVPAYAGIPVTDRRYSSAVVFVTAHEDPKKDSGTVDWRELAKFKGTIVAFMGVKNLSGVIKKLIEGGKPAKTPVSVIERGTLPDQRVVTGTLETIQRKVKNEKMLSPALTVIGDVNRLRPEIAWFEKKRLSGKCVLVTRPRAQAGKLKSALEAEGAAVIEFPSIDILPPKDWTPVDESIRALEGFDWIIFTSTNGVDYFFERLASLGKDARIFAGKKIAVIGESTAAALEARGLRPDLVPESFTSAGLVEALSAQKIAGKRFLMARTDIAPAYLREAILKLGGRVTEVTAYRTLPARDKKERKNFEKAVQSRKIDFITFTSASTVSHFFDTLSRSAKGKIRGARAVSIGPVTSRTLKDYGYKNFLEAGEHTIPGLVETLIHA